MLKLAATISNLLIFLSVFGLLVSVLCMVWAPDPAALVVAEKACQYSIIVVLFCLLINVFIALLED